jgi:hypothetical protein
MDTYCEGGLCITADTYCSADTDCLDGEFCGEAGYCVPKETTCVDDVDCPEGRWCEEGVCVLPPCKDDSECPEAFHCLFDYCLPDEGGGEDVSKEDLAGHWSSDEWGDMLFRISGDEIWGAYAYDTGAIVGTLDPDLVFRGWWSEGSDRAPPENAGDVEFRFFWTGETLTLDGRWCFDVCADATSWREDWDLQRTTDPVPQELEDRFNDPSLFIQHP